MGWWWSSSKSPSESEQPSTTIPAPTIPNTATPPSNPPAAPHPDAEFYASHPHLGPIPTQTSPSDTTTSLISPQTAPTSEYPTTMSCRAAFDSAFYCSSFGGKFNDIYRYGELRSCSEHWADWRFCMGLKTRTKADKEELIQQRYKEKDERVQVKANSEDVWSRRAEGEREFGAFKAVEEE